MLILIKNSLILEEQGCLNFLDWFFGVLFVQGVYLLNYMESYSEQLESEDDDVFHIIKVFLLLQCECDFI